MKKLIISSVVVALLLAIFYFERISIFSLEKTEIPSSKNITIAQVGDFYLYAPLYIALDKGIFAKNGLNVTLINTGGDEKTWAAVISGSAQFGISDPTFIAIASQRGQPGKVISSIVNGVPFWGIAKNNKISSIKTPADLKPYSVATFPSPSTAFTLQKKMFESAALPTNIREGGFGALLALVEAGKADIALELEPNVSQAIHNGYRVVYSLSDIYGDFAITGMTSTPGFIKDNPKIVSIMVQSIQESLDILHNNPAEAANILAKRFPEINRDVAISALNRVLIAGIIPKKTAVSENAWNKAIQLRVDVGDLKTPGNFTDFVDNSFSK